MMPEKQMRWWLIVLVLGALWLTGVSQSNSATPPPAPPLQVTGTPFFLPLVSKDLVCPPSSVRKNWSGLHLGNRQTDWTDALLACIDGRRGGTWPAVVVVLSSQVYSLNRLPSDHPTHPCHISHVEAAPGREKIFDYIKGAAQAGVKVVIRIYPSPGNFVDWDDPEWSNHHLTVSPPAGPEGYCRPALYRSSADVGDEIGKINEFNVSQGFIEWGFEPANEPNAEWYTFRSDPALFSGTAWAEMNGYFSAIYDWVHKYYPGTRVFTPPMAQSAYAESKLIRDVFVTPQDQERCESVFLDNDETGYDMMRETYEIKNDGISWHNYWIQDKEGYAFCPWGQHVSFYFPIWLKLAIGDKGRALISEADLASPPQGMGNVLIDKDADPAATAHSIRVFLAQERDLGPAHYDVEPEFALWLLSEDDPDNIEHRWHTAYSGNVVRPWFLEWWINPE